MGRDSLWCYFHLGVIEIFTIIIYFFFGFDNFMWLLFFISWRTIPSPLAYIHSMTRAGLNLLKRSTFKFCLDLWNQMERSRMRWNRMVFYCLNHLKLDGVKQNDMDFISFNYLPPYFFSSNLGGMNNLFYSIL